MAEVDNYYILLDLDPSVDDWTTVEKAIANKKIEWSKNANTGVASKRTEARRLLDLIGDITSVLSDSQNRRDIAGKAKTILENRHRKAFEDLEPVIAMIIAGGGTVTEKELKTIYQKTGKVISIDKIRDFLRKTGIKIQKPLIDKSLMKEIRKDLDFLKVKNLYSFLELDENDLLKTLQDESQNVYRRIMSLPISPEIDAKKRLVGHCRKIFKTEDEKIKYDNSMKVEPLYELEAVIKLAGKDNVITKEKMEQIIELATKKGVNPEVTIEYVTEYANKKNWKILQTNTRVPATVSTPTSGTATATATATATKSKISNFVVMAKKIVKCCIVIFAVVVISVVIFSLYIRHSLLNLKAKTEEFNNIEKVRSFISSGGDVNKKFFLNSTPLHMATESCNEEIILLLLSKGANVNAKGPINWTPLHILAARDVAKIKNKREIAAILISNGADVNDRDSFGHTPLLLAVDTRDKDFVAFLLSKGADVNAENIMRMNSIEMARRGKDDEQIIKLLEKYGAK